MANIEDKIEKLVKTSIENLGYELYDVQYVKEGQNYFLRIFIEKTNGSIDLNDCEKVNNEISEILDKANYIKEQYFLEISSTGLEKILRKDEHLNKNIGNKVQINLFRPIEVNCYASNKQKEIIGILKSFDNQKVEIENNGIIGIQRKNISQIKTVFNWEDLNLKEELENEENI